MTCGHCGASLLDSAHFCPFCGSDPYDFASARSAPPSVLSAPHRSVPSASPQGERRASAQTAPSRLSPPPARTGPLGASAVSRLFGALFVEKRDLRRAIVFLVIILATLTAAVLLVFSPKPAPSGGATPDELIERLASAMADKDPDGMLACVDPTSAERMDLLLSLSGSETSLEEIFDSVWKKEMFLSRLEVIDIRITGQTGAASLKAEIQYGEYTASEILGVSLASIDGRWYLDLRSEWDFPFVRTLPRRLYADNFLGE